MSAIHQYLDELNMKLLFSPIIASYSITAERELDDRGYFRARLTLLNGDFSDLLNFPHHIHDHSETHVTPGNSLNIIELLTVIEAELCES